MSSPIARKLKKALPKISSSQGREYEYESNAVLLTSNAEGSRTIFFMLNHFDISSIKYFNIKYRKKTLIKKMLSSGGCFLSNKDLGKQLRIEREKSRREGNFVRRIYHMLSAASLEHSKKYLKTRNIRDFKGFCSF
jgi:hypothetical protein